VEALNNDPLTAHEVQPAITVAALVRADERLRAARALQVNEPAWHAHRDDVLSVEDTRPQKRDHNGGLKS